MIYKLIPFTKRTNSLDLLASVIIDDQSLSLSYKLSGDLQKIVIPSKLKDAREIGLWESTCFEFFFLNEENQSYYEFNFSPSGKWNCFFFIQQGDQLQEAECQITKFNSIKENNKYELDIEIDMNTLKDSFRNLKEYKMNLTAVLEEEDLSYWALKHGQERPNFHDFNLYHSNKKVR